MGSPILETRVDAILDRDENIPYTKVLSTHNLNPKQFLYAVKDIRTFVPYVEEEIGDKLREISDDSERIKELFNMDEDFLKEQYDNVIARKQLRFYEGTLANPENIATLVYYALSSNNPQLASTKRKRVINAIKNLPTNLKDYLHSIGLKGIMTLEKNSPLAVLEVFDEVYQRKTKDSSLFDLTQREHLPKWRIRVPNHYWENPSNVEEAIYYALTEDNPQLASRNRKKVVKAVKNLSPDLKDYFRSLGLCGLMTLAFERQDSPLAVLEVFDKTYQKEAKDSSLFDLTQREHLHKWGSKFRAPQSFWQNPINIEVAVYHTLTENNPRLASTDRERVIQGIKDLPLDLKKYFLKLELGGLMDMFEKGKQNSPRVILEAFDRAFIKTTGNPSLDLKFYGKNRLVR